MKLNKTCVWYHGLCGEPNLFVKQALNQLGYYVVAEHIDFYREWFKDRGKSMMERQLRRLKKVDLIAGISFGGYVAYLMSKATGADVLLINPAINRNRSTTGIWHFDVPKDVYNKESNIEIFFGEHDDVVPMRYTQEFLEKTAEEYKGWLVKGMEHGMSGVDFYTIIQNSNLIDEGFKKAELKNQK